jgi:hypothetical protein
MKKNKKNIQDNRFLTKFYSAEAFLALDLMNL